jgi:hypothetical protein
MHVIVNTPSFIPDYSGYMRLSSILTISYAHQDAPMNHSYVHEEIKFICLMKPFGLAP